MEQTTNLNTPKLNNIVPTFADKDFLFSTEFPSLPLYFAKLKISAEKIRRTPPYSNPGLIMYYVNSGSVYIYINGEKVLLENGVFCIIEANCIHYIESIPNAETSEVFCMIMSEVLFKTNEKMYNTYVVPFFHSYHPNYTLIKKDNKYHSKLVTLGNSIYSCINEKPMAYELSIMGYLYGILAVLYKSLDNDFFITDNSLSKNDEAMNQMTSYIRHNVKNSIEIMDLCDIGNVSRTKCFQLFKQYTGDTPSSYILKYRLKVSQNYLTHTSLSIAEISDECGFAHQSHFTSCFSKEYHMTPLQYRKKSKNDLAFTPPVTGL